MKVRKIWKSTTKKVFTIKLDTGIKTVVYFDKNGTAHTVTSARG